MGSTINSSLYECTVMHTRLYPKYHSFRYNLFMFYLDLEELEYISNKLFFFSYNKFNFYSFWEKDHLSLNKPLKQTIQEYLLQNGINTTIANIKLLTLPRFLGYVFNPVSFFFCFDLDENPICSIAEVNNTYHETKLFILPKESANTLTNKTTFSLKTPKHFYISPFMDLNITLNLRVELPQEKLETKVDDYSGTKKVFISKLTGQKTQLTDFKLIKFTIKYPFVTLMVIFRIYFHALLLYLKKIPFFRKTANPEMQRGVYNPHRSISGDKNENKSRSNH